MLRACHGARVVGMRASTGPLVALKLPTFVALVCTEQRLGDLRQSGPVDGKLFHHVCLHEQVRVAHQAYAGEHDARRCTVNSGHGADQARTPERQCCCLWGRDNGGNLEGAFHAQIVQNTSRPSTAKAEAGWRRARPFESGAHVHVVEHEPVWRGCARQLADDAPMSIESSCAVQWSPSKQTGSKDAKTPMRMRVCMSMSARMRAVGMHLILCA